MVAESDGDIMGLGRRLAERNRRRDVFQATAAVAT